MELFREGKLSYRVLTADRRDETLILLARAFCSEPAVSAIAEIKPDMETQLHDWVEFIDYWMDHCTSNGLSVIAIDTDKGRVAGAFTVRELIMMPPGFKEKYTSDAKSLTPWQNCLWHVDEEATKKMPELGEQGAAVDLDFLGVHPDYRGQGIAKHLMRAVLPLCKKAGYKYATIEATSAYTSKAAQRNDFTAVHEEEVKDCLWKGEPVYTNVKPPHGTWTFWVKDLGLNI